MKEHCYPVTKMLDLAASTLIGVSIHFRTTIASTSENDLLHILSGVTCNITNISLLAKSLVGCADLFWLLHVIQSCSWHLASISKPLAFRASRNSSSVKSTCSVISEWLRIRTGPLLPNPSPFHILHQSQPDIWLTDGLMRHQLEDVIFLSDTE